MVSIRDGAIPDPDNLADPNSDPFAGTIYDAGREADPIDLPDEDPAPDPDPTPTQGGDIRLGNAADNQTVNSDPTSNSSVGPGQQQDMSNGIGIGIIGIVVALVGVLALR